MPSDANHAARIAPRAMSDYEILLAEIPSAMRKQLESDGRMFGFLLGVIALMLGACADYYILSLRSLQTTTDALIVGDLIRHGLLLPGFVIVLALPSITKRLNLRRELKYRRLHGKWRWEH